MIGFALCHGWSFDARIMVRLQEALKRRFPEACFSVFDLGFSGTERLPALDASADWIAVGHSYGFAYLMGLPVQWKAAISLNGFTRFCRRSGHPAGTPARLVDAMLKRLADAPRETVAEFRRRCGDQDIVHDHFDREKLLKHLALLRDLDISLPSCPILALAGTDDAIVPIELAKACFAHDRCRFHEAAGDHMRMLTAPEQHIGLIADFVESLANE